MCACVCVFQQEVNNNFLFRPKLDSSCWRKTIRFAVQTGHQTTVRASCFLFSWIQILSIQMDRLQHSGLQLMVFQQRLPFPILLQLDLRPFFNALPSPALVRAPWKRFLRWSFSWQLLNFKFRNENTAAKKLQFNWLTRRWRYEVYFFPWAPGNKSL